MELIRYKRYTRNEIHDIFSPNTNFTSGAGYWGISGIIKVPNTTKDYIFLVTYGQKQGEHEFDEKIDENGLLNWQSQPQQHLNTPQIIDFINHDSTKDNIYLFLRENKKSKYIYLGLLDYVSHDKNRENPVYFKWKILDWKKTTPSSEEDTKIEKSDINYSAKNFEITLKQTVPSSTLEIRKDIENNRKVTIRNINFEKKLRENTDLGTLGEDIVIEYEKNALIKAGRADLAKDVIATKEVLGNAARFDIYSYEVDGTEKYIEVKTTKSGYERSFYISESEVKCSEDLDKQYYLYRLYKLDLKTNQVELWVHNGKINREKLKPNTYTCDIPSLSKK